MSNSVEQGPESYSGKFMVGAALMVATRFFVRLLGLVSVTILARLLTPEDFGIFGTAALVLAFFILIKEVGFGEAVVKTKDMTKDDLDTLWTMRLIMGVLTSISLVLLADIIANFLKEPRLIEVLQVMALVPILDCFYSPASSIFVKNFKFGHDFLLKSVDKFVRVIAIILMALTLKSYWALVYGALLAATFGAIISHIVLPYHPRLTLVNRHKYGAFAFWAYCRGVARYFAGAADEFVVRASENSAAFGIYHVSKDLVRVLITELITPIGQALLPTLVKLSGDSERFNTAVLNTISVYILAGIAISFGIMAVSDDMVLLLFGPQWTEAAMFLALVAIGGACNSMGDINQNIFVAQDNARSAAIFWGARAVTYSVGCLIAGILWGSIGVAIAFTCMSVLVLLFELHKLFSGTGIGWLGYRYFVRPLLSGALMLTTVGALPLVNEFPLFIIVFIKVSVGAITFGAAVLLMWLLAGKPRGAEYSLIERLPEKLRKLVL